MSELLPHGEQLGRAMHWIVDELEHGPRRELPKIVEEASIRFDLSPAQEQWLLFVARATHTHTIH